MESLDQISSKKIVENEIEVIQSRKLMADVVNKLGLYAPISQQGEIKTTSAYLTSPIAVRAASPDSLTDFKKIKLNIDKNNQEVILNDTFKYPLNQVVTTPYGRLQFLPNKNYEKPKQPVKQFYFALIDPRDLSSGLITNLKAEPASKLSSIVNLSYRDLS